MLDAPFASIVSTAAVLLLAVPAAAWLAGFEFGAGRQLPNAESGVVVRFVRASLGAHAVLSPTSLLLAVWMLRGAPGIDLTEGGVETAVLVPLLVLAVIVGLYAGAPFLAGAWSGNLVRRHRVGLGMALAEQARERWPRLFKWLPEPSPGRLHPHAWDYLFSHVPAMYVKARLRSGRWVGGGSCCTTTKDCCYPATASSISRCCTPTLTPTARRKPMTKGRKPPRKLPKQATEGYHSGNIKPCQTKPMGRGVTFVGANVETPGDRQRKQCRCRHGAQ